MLEARERLDGDNEQQMTGLRILARPMEWPPRQIVRNAAWFVRLLRTTEVMIAEAPKDESDPVHPAPVGMRDMGGMGMQEA